MPSYFWINQYAPELTNEKVAIFGIYATQMYALIIQNGQILYKQEMPVSTEQLNQLIQRTYQVTEEKAAQMMVSTSKPTDYQTQIADRLCSSGSGSAKSITVLLHNTADRCFFKCEAYFINCSASQQTGLAESIFSQTNTATQCIQPVTYVERGGKVDLSQLQVDASALTLAFGLALRGL